MRGSGVLQEQLGHWLASDDALLFLPPAAGVGLADMLSERDWTPVSVDLSGIGSKAELMAEMRSALNLDDWFGANWDALNDALHGPEDPAAGPWVLLLKLPAAGTELPEPDLDTLLDIIRDVAAADTSHLRGAIVLGEKAGGERGQGED